jgi:hypothetical protein
MRRLFGGMALGAVLLRGCGSNDAGQQASPTTTARRWRALRPPLAGNMSTAWTWSRSGWT